MGPHPSSFLRASVQLSELAGLHIIGRRALGKVVPSSPEPASSVLCAGALLSSLLPLESASGVLPAPMSRPARQCPASELPESSCRFCFSSAVCAVAQSAIRSFVSPVARPMPLRAHQADRRTRSHGRSEPPRSSPRSPGKPRACRWCRGRLPRSKAPGLLGAR